MSKQVISTERAPKAVGPYAQGVKLLQLRSIIYTAGQIAIDPATGKVIEGNAAAQTHQIFKNLAAILEAGGSGLRNVIKTTVFLKSMDEFKAMNDVYATYFTDDFPARSTVEVAGLPLNVDVEIEAIAFVD